MRIVQLMTDRSRYFNPSKNYWFSFSAFLTDILKYMLLVDINNINVPGQRFCSHFLVQIPRADAEIVTNKLPLDFFLLICYFYILMYNIPTRIFTDLYLKSKRQHFRVFVYKSNLYYYFFIGNCRISNSRTICTII